MPSYCSGIIIWTPAPTADFTEILELRKARKKQQQSTHMFIVTRLMTPHPEIVLELKLGHPAWPVYMLEHLTIDVCYSYLSHSPWEIRRSKELLELGRSVQRVWENNPGTEGHLLNEPWTFKDMESAFPMVMESRML